MALVAMAIIAVTLPVNAQQPPSDELLFIAASVDDYQPYIGQQITYISRIYQRSDFPYRLHYQPPGFAGFWNVQETEQNEYSEAIDSREYRVIELRTILFSSVVETLEIEPGTVSASLPEGPIVVESDPVLVDVRPTPVNAPAGFTGAVGRFEIAAEVDTTTALMNESVLLTVKVQGEGNIDALPAPVWPEFQGWRAVESPPAASSEVIDGRLVGSRTYEIILVPELAGELSIPEIWYIHYDPDLDEYVQAATSPIVVSVAGVAGMQSPQPPLDGTATDERDASDARPIKAAPASLRRSGAETTSSVVFWAMWLPPLLVIAGAAVWRRRRDAWEASQADSRRRNALPNAQAALGRAMVGGDSHSIAAAAAVSSYLSDRFGESLTGLTREALAKRLQDAGVPTKLTQRVEDTLASGEEARYTPEDPSPGPADDRIERASQLLTELDGAIEP